ncbi:MAG TPA: TonB-dependent receptor [Terriglobales bacterium]
MHRILGFAVLVVFAASLSLAQTGTSTIRGTITDPNGRVVPGATVTLTNIATNAVRTTKSTDTGAYVFDLITPAKYRIQVDASGFKKNLTENVVALIGKPTEQNVTLEVGPTQEVVEVRDTSQQALVNTQDATLGNTFDSVQITQLPLEARDVVDLLSLQPGATREGYVTGARADQSNVTLDGVDINNSQTANTDTPLTSNNLQIGQLDTDRQNITTGPVLRLNSEAIEEFRVTTANGNANQGRSSGSQVNLVTKSGTNNWHGAASEFYRSTGFTANDWFNNHATPQVPRSALIRNTYEGGIGGPIVKNRAFFFYDYAGRHDASAQSVVQIVPLPSLGQGIINYTYCTATDPVTGACTGSIQQASLNLAQSQAAYPDVGINQTALDALTAAAKQYPANDTSSGDGLNTGGFRFNSPTPTKLNSHVAKLDFNLTSRQTAFIRANVIYDHQTLAQYLPGVPARVVWNHPWGIAVGHTWSIGSNWVNSFRYGLTRQAFTDGGDSTGNDVAFRFVFQPTSETHSVSRVTPVHNFTDDVSWIKGNHTIQFGTNIRTTSNTRISLANAYDFASTNPSFYFGAGAHLSDQFQNYLDASNLPGSQSNGQALNSVAEVQNAAAAVIGRFAEFTTNYTFDKNGSLLPPGSPTNRDFANQAYDEYVQDTWKVRPSLTLTLGLRYSLERPVYEKNGFEVQPGILQSNGSCTVQSMGEFFHRRIQSAYNGVNLSDLICVTKSGPANGGPPMYNWDKNNFQPRIAIAWSPDKGKTAIRGGFALTNDYFGQALAVDWDLNNTLGFTSNYTTPANTFGTANSENKPLAPAFTGFNQNIEQLLPSAGQTLPGPITFPLSQPLDYGERIESGLDSSLHAPTEYVWNLTFERELPKGMVMTASYIGRAGRSLLARRDVMGFSDLRDPKTGVDWYTAGTALEKLRQKGTDISQIPALLPAKINQYFDDMFPMPANGGKNLATVINDFEGGGWDPTWTNAQAVYGFPFTGYFSGNDWTDTQAELDLDLVNDSYPANFMQPQYGALSTWSSIGNSNYNAFTLSLRQRVKSLLLDFNYTYAHSLDDASGLQGETGFTGFGNNVGNGAFIVNAIRQGDNYATSDFDIRHSINIDSVWQLPFGKGQAFMSNASRVADALLGGWQLSGIFRWNTGLPVQPSPFDDARWATSWDVQSAVVPLTRIHSCPNKPATGSPKLFGGCNLTAIYQNFRNAYPGETGSRNYLRMPGYVGIDLGFGKSWKMPWSEGHQLQLRWDVFNVTNTQHFGAIDSTRTGIGVGLDPKLNGLTPPADWSNFTQIQGQPRVMQIGARYSF